MLNKTIETQIRYMQSGKEIDALVAEKMFGFKFIKPTHGSCCTCQTCGYDYDNCICGYSEYLEKAWEIIERFQYGKYPSKFPTNCKMTISISADEIQNEMYTCKIESPTLLVEAKASTFELSVCRAALLAIFSE